MIDEAVFQWARQPWLGDQAVGDGAAHRTLADLVADLETLSVPPRDQGKVHAMVCRRPEERRTVPDKVQMCPNDGVVGDRWAHGSAEPEMQVAVMRVDIAHLIANGQHLAMFGDNLFVDLDLSVENLPPGTELMVGEARCVVSKEPHDGCNKFAARFGMDALRLTARPQDRHLRIRGVYLTVLEPGEVCRDSRISVLSRP